MESMTPAKEKTMKKLLVLALSLLLAVGFVFASGSSEAADSGKTVITWWSFPTFGNDGSTEETLIEAFEAANPDITVKLEMIDFTTGPNKITAAIEGGSAPDILFDAPGRIIEYGKNGKLVALDDLFTDEFIADVDSEGLISACSDGTNYWMYPLSSSPFWMSINKEAWEEAGAWQYINTEGDRLWTTDNFIKAMQALGKAGYVGVNIYCGGQGGDQGTRALVDNLYSGQIHNDERTAWTADKPEIKAALQVLLDLYNEGAIDFGRGIAAADEIQLYRLGQIASSICWGTSNAKNNPTDQYTQYSIPFPSDDGVPALEYLVNGFCVFNNGDEAKAEAAKKFITFICDDPEYGPYSVVQSAAFPVRTSFGSLYDDAESTLLASWTKYYAPYYNTMDKFAQMRVQWWNMLQFISTGDKTIDQAVKDFDVNANAD